MKGTSAISLLGEFVLLLLSLAFDAISDVQTPRIRIPWFPSTSCFLLLVCSHLALHADCFGQLVPPSGVFVALSLSLGFFGHGL